MSVKSNLIAARALIEKGWVKNNFVRVPGTDTSMAGLINDGCTKAPEGACFCTTGAVIFTLCDWVGGGLTFDKGKPEIEALYKAMPMKKLPPSSLPAHNTAVFAAMPEVSFAQRNLISALQTAHNNAARVRYNLFDMVEALETYNDDPATTQADILALFDRAIANAED